MKKEWIELLINCQGDGGGENGRTCYTVRVHSAQIAREKKLEGRCNSAAVADGVSMDVRIVLKLAGGCEVDVFELWSEPFGPINVAHLNEMTEY